MADDRWHRFEVREIEDLRNMILGAKLQAMQMAGQKVGGTVAFSACDGIIFSTGLIAGNASVRGICSEDAITLGIGVSWGKGSRACLRNVVDGCVGIVLPGDELDILFGPGTLYIAATIPTDRIDGRLTPTLRTGVHPRPLDGASLDPIRKALQRVHRGELSIPGINVGSSMLCAVLAHHASGGIGSTHQEPAGYETIVRLAREYIERHLAQPISIGDVAEASGASLRTFYRAFLEVLGETPNSYVRRLRLHRIRSDLMADGRETTVFASTRRWGISEHGRMSGWYRGVFGERPSATLSSAQQRRFSEMWL